MSRTGNDVILPWPFVVGKDGFTMPVVSYAAKREERGQAELRSLSTLPLNKRKSEPDLANLAEAKSVKRPAFGQACR